ncbi:MAG: hypothetical protein JRI23_00850 [Deltaproteobacteria bacterium]|nr:hypothetical protein [Deltaproteobacteria bacterium]MBW2530001.1 hypothetical protein [Deltaproteobacteria bacterium]
MTKTLILSHETTRQLLEAHASLAAWYYQLTDALRAAGGQAEPPSDAQRKAFLEQVAGHFPEIAEVARSIDDPRPYVPPPVFAAPAVPPPAPAEVTAPPAAETPAGEPGEPPPPDVVPPEVSDASPPEAPPPAGAADADAVAPPPMVDPKKVRYD